MIASKTFDDCKPLQVGDEFKLVSHLNEAEVDQVTEFLNTLSFEPRSTR